MRGREALTIVNVEVLERGPTGVQVRILDGDLANRVGFIRRAELSWDQRPGVEPPWPQEGEQIKARVLGGGGARYVRLSLRLGEPWEDERVEERFEVGQVVQGHVVQLSRYGAFVQLVPGVNALARTASIPLLARQKVEDVLAVGDEVQAVITEINPAKKQIEISLTERLRQISLLPPEERRAFQVGLFQAVLAEQSVSPSFVDGGAGDPVERESQENPLGVVNRLLAEEGGKRQDLPEFSLGEGLYPPLAKLERVLIVDDDWADRWRLRKRIEQAFAVEVDAVASGRDALEQLNSGVEYDLALIDVNLGGEDPVEIAEKLQAAQALLLVVFVSRAPQADTRLPGKCLFVLKDQDFRSIVQFIKQLQQGEVKPDSGASEGRPPLSTDAFVRHLGMEAFARRSLEETLRPMLRSLRRQTRVSHAFVFQVDSESREVSIVAQDPLLSVNAQKYLLDRLYYSPVQNVAEDEEPYYETDTLVRRRHPRFRRLYRVLPFRSCLGLPLIIPDVEARYALFLFDENRPRLEVEDLSNARLAVRFLQVALERAIFFEFMQRYEARYARGVLIDSLMHELGVQMDALNAQIERLPVALKKARKPLRSPEREEGLRKLQEITERLQKSQREMGKLVDAYLKIARARWQDVDVNDVVERVRLQMGKMAEEEGVVIHVEAGEVPPVRAIASRLEQVLLNLVLNAIQQIARQKKMMAELPKKRRDDHVLLQGGQIIIQTRCVETDPDCPVQILVIDTGPGVRYPDRERIFRLDTTSRKEGHGWEMFISRNLTEMMHGRLRLVGSLRFIGAAFAVELPSSARQEERNGA